MNRRITIVEMPVPHSRNINDELQWLGSSLGLFGERDRDKSCFRIFVTLIKETHRERPLSSDQIAHQLDLSRGTVIHHINRLMEHGIVTHARNGYTLRMDTLQHLIDEINRDMERTFDNIRRVSKDIDTWLGL